jgi:predicted transcriptional regulator
MPRILADLPEDDIKWLDRLAEEQGRSRAAVLRQAVSAFRADTAREGIERYFGIWKDREDIGDAVDWQRRERASAARPWDAGYEDVKAEFPDLFEEREDRDRERGTPGS